MASSRNNRPRRIAITLALAVAGCSAALAYGIAVPELVAWKLRRELADRGLANARFRIVSVGLDRLALADVELRPGLHLGEVELDAGISLLWRDAERITVRRARITRDTLAGEGSSALGALPFRWLRLEDSVLVVEGVDVAIAGTFAVGEPPASAEATARLPVLTIGTVTLRDVVIRLHAGRACATARAETAEVDACAMLRSWAPDELAVTWATSDHGAGWRASGDARLAWSAGLTIRDGRVEATVARGSFEGLAFSDAAVTASFGGTAESVAATGTVRIANATAAHGSDTFAVAGIEAPIEIHARAMPAGWTVAAGTLDARARAISGTLGGMPVRAREVTLASARPIARGFDLGTLRWTATELAFGELRLAGAAGTVDDQRTVRWHAVAARWHEVRATSPVGTISARRVVGWRAPLVRWREVRIVDVESTITTRELRWRAREASHEGAHLIDPEGTVALDHGEHALAWRRAVAGPLELGHGEIALRTVSGGVQLGRVSVQAYGGQLALAQPGWITVGQPLDLAVHGLQLHDTLRALGLRRIDGRGLLDGHLELHATATGWELGRASLHSRGVGSLRAIDIAWLQAAAKLATTERFGLHHRIAGALADFDYAHLAIELGPRGARPELRVALRGRGKRVWQDLDLVFNVRGVHSTIRHLSHRAPG